MLYRLPETYTTWPQKRRHLELPEQTEQVRTSCSQQAQVQVSWLAECWNELNELVLPGSISLNLCLGFRELQATGLTPTQSTLEPH